MILNYRTNRRLSSRARCRLDWQPRTNKISKNYEMIEQTFDRSVKSVTSCFYSNLRKKIEFVCVCVYVCILVKISSEYLLKINIFFKKKKKFTHENPIQPIASDNISPRIDGKEFPAGKYAWNLGCCQWVICKYFFFFFLCNLLHFSSFSWLFNRIKKERCRKIIFPFHLHQAWFSIRHPS